MPGLRFSNGTSKHLPQRKVTSVQAVTRMRTRLGSCNVIYDSLDARMGKQRMGYLYGGILLSSQVNEMLYINLNESQNNYAE